MADETVAKDEIENRLYELKKEKLKLIEDRLWRRRYRRIDFLFPENGRLSRHAYAKTISWFEATKNFLEVVIFGGNRTGKTEAGAYMTALHATGEYPDWWPGRRFDYGTSGVVAGKDGKTVRDTVQAKLIGFPMREWGTGMIPADRLIMDECKRAQGTPNLFDTLVVKHASGDKSIINLKAYESGRQAFEGTDRDYVWEDEEAPIEIHRENVQRVFDRQGIVYNTYTPLLGQTELTLDMHRRALCENPSVFTVTLSWDDVPHITDEMIAAFADRYPPHEMKARRWGIPKLGSGAVFTTDFDEEIGIKPFVLPKHWPRAYGLDFGWSPHPTAAVWGAWDREADVIYLYSEHRMKQELPSVHADAIKARGDWLWGNSETAGTNASDGQRMINIYKGLGLHLRPAVKGTEANIYNLRQRIETGRLKVFTSMPGWREEYESYHRKDGRIVKEQDDLIDATLYLLSDMSTFKTQPAKRMTGIVNPVSFGDFTV